MTDQRNGRPGRAYDENAENWAGDKPAVTDQAIEAALKSWFGEGYQGGRLLGVSATFDIRSEMRAALEAALPHMVPDHVGDRRRLHHQGIMTMNPGRCPRCEVTNYRSDPSNGGAGRNLCNACGYRGPVREFHRPAKPMKKIYNTGTLRTDTPAAPIRQYKDD